MSGWITVGLVGILASTLLIMFGLLRWEGDPGRKLWKGGWLLWPGVVVLVLSAGWLLLIAYADAVIR